MGCRYRPLRRARRNVVVNGFDLGEALLENQI